MEIFLTIVGFFKLEKLALLNLNLHCTKDDKFPKLQAQFQQNEKKSTNRLR
jgi:hypothetical protein